MEPKKLPPADADVAGAAAGTDEYQDANDDEGMVWISRMELIAGGFSSSRRNSRRPPA